MLNYKSDKVRILFNFLEKSSVQYNGETANEKLRYTYNTVGVDADGLWITLHSRMDKSEVQPMQDVGDAMALAGYAATLSVVGAEVGVLLATYGNSLSGLALCAEGLIDLVNGDLNKAAIVDRLLSFIGKRPPHFINNLMRELPTHSQEVIRQGYEIKKGLFEDVIEYSSEEKQKVNK